MQSESVIYNIIFSQERVYFLTGIALGMAIHFKIYPIIFTLPLYSALTAPNRRTGEDTIGSYFRSLFDFNRARVRLVLGNQCVYYYAILI